MKFSILATMTSALVLAPSALAWRVEIFDGTNYSGLEFTKTGPGHAGSACGSLDAMSNKVRSIHWYATDSNHKNKCNLILYDSPGCVYKSGDWQPVHITNDYQNSNTAGEVWNKDVSSIGVEC